MGPKQNGYPLPYRPGAHGSQQSSSGHSTRAARPRERYAPPPGLDAFNRPQRRPEQARSVYSPPPGLAEFEKAHFQPHSYPPSMNGDSTHLSRPFYDSGRRPPLLRSQHYRNDGRNRSDRWRTGTTPTKADEQLVRPRHNPTSSPDRSPHQWEKRRITKYNRHNRSRSSSSSGSSSGSSSNTYRSQAKSQGRGLQKTGSAGQQGQPQAEAPSEPVPTGFEKYITPLRLGILLGCFDIIGGSLSAWMTMRRFGKSAKLREQAQAQLKQGAGGDREGGGKLDSQSGMQRSLGRPSKGSRRRGRGSGYDSLEGSSDEMDERERRVGDHIRDQRRFSERGGRRGRP